MLLNLTNGLVILLGLGVTWFVLFSLFTEKSQRAIGLKLGVIVLILSPFIAWLSYDAYAMLSRQLFIMRGYNGEIQLPYSPMRITNLNEKGYCDQFKDDKGNTITTFSIANNDKAYCGMYWGMYSNKSVFLPYRLLDKNTAIYWASPELRIVGSAPKLPELNGDKESNLNKPNAILVPQATQADFIVLKEFELPSLKSQKMHTIEVGTILPGFAMDGFHSTEKTGHALFRVKVASYSCTAETETHSNFLNTTVIAKVMSLNCFHDESKNIKIVAAASVPGRAALFPKIY